MFGKVFFMDLKRSFAAWKLFGVVAGSAVLLIAAGVDIYWPTSRGVSAENLGKYIGAVDLMIDALTFDVFKMVTVLLLSGLYTNCFCKDESNHYLRMVLSRTDVMVYTRSKFLSNTIVILSASVLTFFVSAAIYMLMGLPVISENADGGMLNTLFYIEAARAYPYLFVLMMGIQVGMVAAAFSSIGMLYSVYQPDAFICVGVSGLTFFLMLCASPTLLEGTPFDILLLLTMRSVLPSGQSANPWMAFSWGMLYPAMVIVLCCMKFEKRMKWRAERGVI